MLNRYSNYPSMVDDIKRLSEVQEMSYEHKIKVARYTELALKQMTAKEEVEFEGLVSELSNYQLNSSDWNKLVEAVYNLHSYFKDQVLGDISNLFDMEENDFRTLVSELTSNASTEIITLKESSLNEIMEKTSDLVSQGTLGFEFYNKSYTIPTKTNKVVIPISQYNKNIDNLIVFVNGALVTKDRDYIIGLDGYYIQTIEGLWDIGTIIDFIVIKKTVTVLDYFDVGLIPDNSIRKEKLTQDFQEEIAHLTSQLGELPYLDTFEKNIVGAINEVNRNKQDATTSELNTTNKSIVGAINEVNAKLQSTITLSGTAPSNPKANQIWIDTANNLFKYYSGSKWISLNAVYSE